MLKYRLIIAIFCFASLPLLSQNRNRTSVPLIGSEAPSFKAETTNGPINFPADYGKSWKIIFCHPKDFTPVCSSELLELAYLQPEFDKLGVKVLVVSVDQLKMHQEWKTALEKISYDGRPPEEINFPIVSDANYEIATKYGMIHKPASAARDIRGVYIIDPDNIVQSVSFYPMSIGRNMDEYIRTIKALQTAQNNVVIPANWQPGKDVMLSYMTSEQEELQQKGEDTGIYQVSWFMTFQRLP